MNLWTSPVIEFDDISRTHPSVVVKAKLQSLSLTEQGVGVGASVSGSSFDFTRGGIIATTLADYIEYPLTAGQAERLSGQGRIQFDVRRDDMLGIDTDDNIPLGFMTSGSSSTGAVVRTVKASSAKPQMWNDRQGALKVNAAWATGNGEAAGAQPYVVITSDMDEWVTLVLSWDASFLWWSVDGETVTKARHAPSFGAATKFRLGLDASTTANRVAIRNLIVADIPAPNTRDFLGVEVPKCAIIAHSFATTAGGLPEPGFDVAEAGGCRNHVVSNFHATYVSEYGPMWLKNTGHDGWLATLTGEGEDASTLQTDTESFVADSLTIKNRIHRWRPDFCLVMVHNSNEPTGITDPPDGTSSLETAINTIIANLVGQGVVPVIVLEQNRDKGITPQERTLNNKAVEALANSIIAANGANYIGLVDAWTPTGGSTVNRVYVETTGSLIHPNYHAGPVYGKLIAREIKRLVDDPPAYSRWSNRNSSVVQ